MFAESWGNMNKDYNLCIIKPNKSSFSETFIQAHVDYLAGNKKVLYGGSFPLYDHQDRILIKSKLGLISYLIQKKIFNRKDIQVRNLALTNYLVKENIDIILAEYGMVGAMITKACSVENIPLVIHFHGADAHHAATINEYKELYKQAFDYASAIVVVSNDMLKTLIKLGAPESKIILNPYGVNVNRFSPVSVINSDKSFLSVGRFVEKKAPLLVIEAFKTVHDTYKNAHLWMVGDGPLLNAAKQKVNELHIADGVTFTGVQSTEKIIELMKNMRCFVQHSVTAHDGDMEGTPNTILEASASALPIVSTFHAGIKEAVLDGITGLLCQEYDVKGMAERMLMIAESAELAQQLGNAGRKHIVKNYNIQDRIESLNLILQNSLN